MTQNIACFAGIDMSKDMLDLAFSNDSDIIRFANTQAGCRKLATLLISESKSRTYYGLWLREPTQFQRDALPRAHAYLERIPAPL